MWVNHPQIVHLQNFQRSLKVGAVNLIKNQIFISNIKRSLLFQLRKGIEWHIHEI